MNNRTILTNAVFLSVVAFLESLQVFVVMLWFAHFWRQRPALLDVVFAEDAGLVGHTQMSSWLLIFIALCVVGQFMAFAVNGRQLSDQGFVSRLRSFAVVEGVLVFLMLSALFKIVVYADRPQLAIHALHAVFVLAVINKLFWPEVKRVLDGLFQTLTDPRHAHVFNRMFTAVFFVAIALLIYIPDPEAALARLFVGEQFHHWDSSVTGPMWAYATGCMLNIDIISRYGVGVPVFLSWLTKFWGGVDYLNIMRALIAVALVYYLLCFAFLRVWFSNLLVAFATVLVAIRVQMFHTGAYPLTFHYPSGTPLRFCFDIFVIWMIWLHLRKGTLTHLTMAAIGCGIALFHLTAEGLYLTLAFYFYLTVQLLTGETRRVLCPSFPRALAVAGCYLLVPCVFFLALYAVEGRHILGPEYWRNLIEFANFFLSGFGDNPIYQSLKSHLFLQSAMGFVYPLVYVATLLVVTSLWLLKKNRREHLLVAVLCVYGLGLYHYYVTLSMWTSYYMNGLPFVFVLGWGTDMLVRQLKNPLRHRLLVFIVGASVYALLTNHNFISYPNWLNFSRNPFVDPLVAQPLPNGKPYFYHLFYEYPDAYKLPVNSLGETQEPFKFEKDFATDRQLVEYFRRESDFSQDAGLIARLTAPSQAVALISSFELMILMQAKRKPFFYYCPIINSRPMWMRNFVVTGMYTRDHLKKTLDQLEAARPPYVFMERILMTPSVPQAYAYDSPGLFELLNYVFEHYTPVENGRYLTAWKLK